MVSLQIAIALVIRIVLVVLFLPFSAADKIFNFSGAVAQAREAAPSRAVAIALIVCGLLVEIFMSLGVVTGIADRACAFVLAGYCAATALFWKQFWKPGDFSASASSQAGTGATGCAIDMWQRSASGDRKDVALTPASASSSIVTSVLSSFSSRSQM